MSDGMDMMVAELRGVLSAEGRVCRDEPLWRRTTLRVGGNADMYVEPASEEDLAAVVNYCVGRGLKYFVLGRGSNLLIGDGGIRGVVIGLGHSYFGRVEVVGERLRCGAGARLKAVAVEARRSGLGGFEFMEGIPGSVGGALRMNAGAMGFCTFDVVDRVRLMDGGGAVVELAGKEMGAGYRSCEALRGRIALGAVLEGRVATAKEIEERGREYNEKRWSSQPAVASAGCVFKNPGSIAAGRLIEELGLKGTRLGGAVISPVHGNFIVNEGGATAGDVMKLIALVREKAMEARGIELETELQIVGDPA